MSRYSFLPWIAAVSAIAVPTVFSQTAPAGSAPVSRAPQAQAAPYRSALESYQPFADEKVLPWKQANETVQKRGGWRAYAKEVQDAAAPGERTPSGHPAGAPSVPAKTEGQP